MSKFHFKSSHSDHYATIRQKQEALAKKFSCCLTQARVCPYCDHKVEYLSEGCYAACSMKCDKCKEIIYFPPTEIKK